jgi:hypothetical protein
LTKLTVVKQVCPAAEGVDGGVAAQANASSQAEVANIAQVASDNGQRNILNQRGQLELGCRHRDAMRKLSEVKRLGNLL